MQKMHEANQFLRVRSANEHNLKNVDINIPKNNINDIAQTIEINVNCLLINKPKKK